MYAEDRGRDGCVTATDTQIALAAVDVLVDGAVFGGFDLVGGTMNISVTGSSVSADATAERELRCLDHRGCRGRRFARLR